MADFLSCGVIDVTTSKGRPVHACPAIAFGTEHVQSCLECLNLLRVLSRCLMQGKNI